MGRRVNPPAAALSSLHTGPLKSHAPPLSLQQLESLAHHRANGDAVECFVIDDDRATRTGADGRRRATEKTGTHRALA
jgi:hypothetical protein